MWVSLNHRVPLLIWKIPHGGVNIQSCRIQSMVTSKLTRHPDIQLHRDLDIFLFQSRNCKGTQSEGGQHCYCSLFSSRAHLWLRAWQFQSFTSLFLEKAGNEKKVCIIGRGTNMLFQGQDEMQRPVLDKIQILWNCKSDLVEWSQSIEIWSRKLEIVGAFTTCLNLTECFFCLFCFLFGCTMTSNKVIAISRKYS